MFFCSKNWSTIVQKHLRDQQLLVQVRRILIITSLVPSLANVHSTSSSIRTFHIFFNFFAVKIWNRIRIYIQLILNILKSDPDHIKIIGSDNRWNKAVFLPGHKSWSRDWRSGGRLRSTQPAPGRLEIWAPPRRPGQLCTRSSPARRSSPAP